MGCVLVELMKNIIQGKCNVFDNLALKTRRYTYEAVGDDEKGARY